MKKYLARAFIRPHGSFNIKTDINCELFFSVSSFVSIVAYCLPACLLLPCHSRKCLFLRISLNAEPLFALRGAHKLKCLKLISVRSLWLFCERYDSIHLIFNHRTNNTLTGWLCVLRLITCTKRQIGIPMFPKRAKE